MRKQKISYWMKDSNGQIYAEGWIPATRFDYLDRWMKTLPQPCSAALEATGWVYDHLKPHAAALKVAHPLMLRAIAAAKKKNDGIDANKICDCLRCDFLPECYRWAQRAWAAAPTHMRGSGLDAPGGLARSTRMITGALLRCHRNPGSAEAVEKWKPGVAKVLRRG